MDYQVLFSLKNNEKVFTNVVCCSRDWLIMEKMVIQIVIMEKMFYRCTVGVKQI